MRISDCSSDVCSSDLRPSGSGRTKAAMTTTNHPRRLVPASELGLGVRPGAGVLGLSKAEPKVPQEESHSEGTLIVGEGIQVKGEIQSCTTLIVEGKVEASLEAVELAVRDSGHYAGPRLVATARTPGPLPQTRRA